MSNNACPNVNPCPCTYDCHLRGRCCECIKYHRETGGAPGCMFSKEAEATYDRSLKALFRDKGFLPAEDA